MIYHSLIPEYLSEGLERVQRMALRIIYGGRVDIAELFDQGIIEPLKGRREALCLKFALKAEQNPRFSQKWFRPTPTTSMQLRDGTRRKYVEPIARTERFRNNPVNNLIRILNEHYSE